MYVSVPEIILFMEILIFCLATLKYMSWKIYDPNAYIPSTQNTVVKISPSVFVYFSLSLILMTDR